MLEVNIIFFEILLILSFFIIIFIYSTISADTIISLSTFLLFLTFLIPYYVLLARLKKIISLNNFEEISILNLLFFYSNIINIFIGISTTFYIVCIVSFRKICLLFWPVLRVGCKPWTRYCRLPDLLQNRHRFILQWHRSCWRQLTNSNTAWGFERSSKSRIHDPWLKWWHRNVLLCGHSL